MKPRSIMVEPYGATASLLNSNVVSPTTPPPRGLANMTEGRKAVHAYVSDEAHENWHNAGQAWGVSVSALLEALAADLDNLDGVLRDRDETIVKAARQIDASRRRRRRS